MKKIIWFGFLLWILMFVIVSALVGFGLYKGVWMELLAAVISGIIAFVLAGYIKPTNAGTALKMGLSWIIIATILDLLVTVRFNSTFFNQWTTWVGYGLVFIVPFLRIKKMTAGA